MSLFIEILKNAYNLEAEVANYLLENATFEQYAKRTFLINIGQVCDKLFFLEKGLARGFYQQEGQGTTSWFVKEGDFIYSPHSFLSQVPAKEGVEILEDTTLVVIPHAKLKLIYDTYPQTNEIGRRITEKYILRYDERLRILRHQTIGQRVQTFIDTYPDFFARAPKHHIATFLGTDASGLSHALGSKHQKCKK